jgi:hypothetical protein
MLTYADYISYLQARDLLNDHIMPRPSLLDSSLPSKLASAATAAAMTQQVLAYVSIRQHTVLAYVSIRQHTSSPQLPLPPQ